MNRKLTTAGLAVLGAASIIPTSAQMGVEQKPWAVSAQLRGFYDDNYLTYPKALRNAPGFDDNTFGFDISPSASYSFGRGSQTSFDISYLYTLRYYADRADNSADHSHQANLKFTHAFNDRYTIDLKDSFVIAQEPSIIDPTISLSVPARSEGNNIRNQAGLQFNATVAENFGLTLGYNNTIYDYEQDAPDAGLGTPPVGSRSSVLDRVEHAISLDGNYNLAAKTTLILGYTYGIADYTSQDLIFAPSAQFPTYPFGVPGLVRDRTSHTITVGARHSLNDQLSLAGRVGVEITDFDSDLFEDQTGPFAEASARWTYAMGSAIQLGLRHQRVASDVRQITTGGTTVLNADAEATSVFLSLAHRISAKITANAMAQYQHSVFNGSGGGSSDPADDLFYGGVNLTYDFTKNVSAELGYTYDRLDSDLPLRSFTRNRVYVGTRLTY